MMKNVTKIAFVSLLIAACGEGGGESDIIESQLNLRSEPADYIVLLRRGAKVVTTTLGVEGKIKRVYKGATDGFVGNFTKQVVEALKKDPNVLLVEPDGIASVSTVQTLGPSQWGLDRLDARRRTQDMQYNYEGDGNGVDVFVVDTGIRLDHQEFEGRAASHWDYVENDKDAQDEHGHGTHVAGTIGGTTVGVAKKVNLWASRVLNASGVGSYSTIIAAIDDITALKIANPNKRVIGNMSLGGGKSEALNEVVNASVAAGVVWVVAAGNSNWNACDYSPSSATDAVTVGAIDSDDRRSTFSNWGTCVDVFAPGSIIYSSGASGRGSYLSMSGTSMASPHVAGAAALYMGVNPRASARQTIEWLLSNSTKNVITDQGEGSPNKLLYTLNLNQTLKVSDIDGKRSNVTIQKRGRLWSGPAERWSVRFEVEVTDTNNSLMQNAIVTYNSCTGIGSCTTGIDGRCIVSKVVWNMHSGPCEFSVTGVTRIGYKYDPGLNSDFDGDSDGTTIVVK